MILISELLEIEKAGVTIAMTWLGLSMTVARAWPLTPLVNEHLSMIRVESNGCSDDWIMREHKRRLIAWLKDLNLPDGETMEEQTIKRLVAGPSSQVTSWQWYDINGYLFYTAAKDRKTVSQNSGVRIEALEKRTSQNTI